MTWGCNRPTSGLTSIAVCVTKWPTWPMSPLKALRNQQAVVEEGKDTATYYTVCSRKFASFNKNYLKSWP